MRPYRVFLVLSIGFAVCTAGVAQERQGPTASVQPAVETLKVLSPQERQVFQRDRDDQAAIPRLVGWHQHSNVSLQIFGFHRVSLDFDGKGLFVRTIRGDALLPVEGKFLEIHSRASLGPGPDWNGPNSSQGF